MDPSRSTTAPTRGFGATRPQPRHARSRARCIASGSETRSEADAETDPSIDMPRLGIEVRVRLAQVLILPRLIAQLADELDGHEIEPGVQKQHLARGAAVQRHGADGVERRVVVEPHG